MIRVRSSVRSLCRSSLIRALGAAWRLCGDRREILGGLEHGGAGAAGMATLI